MRPGLLAGTIATVLALGCTGAPKEPQKAAPAAPQGETFNSGEYTATLPLGLQASAAYVPDNNPMSQPKIELGRKLYFDGRLSKGGTISCATCQDADKGFSDGRSTSMGVAHQTGARNAPTVDRSRGPSPLDRDAEFRRDVPILPRRSGPGQP